MDIQQVKQRFGIIGNSPKLNRALEIALQVAKTDLSVLITGESGTGKEIIPKIIHHNSARKHNEYIAVNCGAIPEGTIDSELFGHEKGAFTGAYEKRKGYFEVADKGTIFLDEVAELPLETQVRLLRVLETGEFMKVGSSKVQKTDVRVIAATNVDLVEAIQKGKFREDLYYRLNTVPIHLPPLRERKEDIPLLFRKFAADFSEKYNMPPIRLTDEARQLLINYYWPGNIRQLKNVTEQISIIEKERLIDAETLKKYLPEYNKTKLPAVYHGSNPGTVDHNTFMSEREILYKLLFDMKRDIDELKKVIYNLKKDAHTHDSKDSAVVLPSGEYDIVLDSYKNDLISENSRDFEPDGKVILTPKEDDAVTTTLTKPAKDKYDNIAEEVEEAKEESLSLNEKEKELIIKALKKHNGKRRPAAKDLGISERTLYRKIKEYKIDL